MVDKSRMMALVGHVEGMGGEIREYLIVNVRCRWEDNIKMGVKEAKSVSI
jgi:hypothetical protein